MLTITVDICLWPVSLSTGDNNKWKERNILSSEVMDPGMGESPKFLLTPIIQGVPSVLFPLVA